MEYTGKKVAIVGYGVNNAELLPFLQERGALVTVLDMDTSLESTLINVDHRLGEHYLDSLTDFEVIFRTPRLPYLSPQIQAAQAAGVIVTSQTQLFLEECPARIIAVTGTKGKGTVSSLIKSMLDVAHLHGDIQGNVYLAGNIGVSPIGILDQLQPEDWMILELSSFQTQDLKHSPHIAVILNITQDHLDHHKSLSEYHEAKRNLVRHQSGNDYVVINKDSEVAMTFLDVTSAQPYFYSGQNAVTPGAYRKDTNVTIDMFDTNDTPIVNSSELKIPGNHNVENVAAATVAARLAGASIESIKLGATRFQGLPFHIEFIAEKNGVKFYNDSFATAPDATIVAIKSFTDPITLIAGGSSKGADFTELAKAIASSSVEHVIAIGQEAEAITRSITELSPHTQVIQGGDAMAEIVKQAAEARDGAGIVLLSPGCASFGMFKSYIDRGQQFTHEVESL